MKHVAKRTLRYESINLARLTERAEFCHKRGSIMTINPEIVMVLLEKAEQLKGWQDQAKNDWMFPE